MAASILRPKRQFSSALDGGFRHLLQRWIFEANVAKIIRPSTFLNISLILSPTFRSDIVNSGISLFVLSDNKQRTPSLPISAILSNLPVPNRCKIKFKSQYGQYCPGVYNNTIGIRILWVVLKKLTEVSEFNDIILFITFNLADVTVRVLPIYFVSTRWPIFP